MVRVKEKHTESPFKKFLFNGLGIGKRELNKLIEESNSLEKEYQRVFDDLINHKTEQRLIELESMHKNNKERRSYEMIQISDIPKSVLVKYPDIEDVFSEKDPFGEGMHISGIVNEKSFPREFRVEISEVYPDIVEKKVSDEIRRKEILSSDKKYFDFLKK
jgi:hypothetical protein